jgi:hypothetical protein
MDMHDLFRRHGEHHRADSCRLHIAAYIAYHRLGHPATMSGEQDGGARAELGFTFDQQA